LVLLAAGIGAVLLPAGEKTKSPAEALAQFQKAWKPAKGHMRPLDDQGWKVRMEAFQQLVRSGKQAVPVLTEALAKGDTDTRVFAAQALAFLAEPGSRPAVEAALQDANPAVRLYSMDTLSMMLPPDQLKPFQKVLEKDGNGDVKSHLRFALERDDKPQPAAIQKSLLDYDLKKVNTAKLGQAAPDFTLSDPLGKSCSLGQFQGKKAVVLVFIYGDT
jgi:HEAT repeat protein